MSGKLLHHGAARVLIAVGLVLVGLTAGILGMMVAERGPDAPTTPERIVERVQLGNPEPPEALPVPDSLYLPPGTDLLNQAFRRVADRVTPAVVYIQVETSSESDAVLPWHPPFDDNGLVPTVGSGVSISPQGYVVTNHHVVEDAERVYVTLSDKRLFEARVVGADPSTDLAVLEIGGDARLPAIRLGDSDRLEVGEWVLAIGNPFRLTSTVTAGIVSAKGRQVNIIGDRFGIEDFIQTDAAINPGNSGGALVNLQGELVGIATAIATESGSYEGYGFAVPVNLVERVVTDLIEYGEVRRGYLGVAIGNVNAAEARRLGMDRIQGVYVSEVTSRGAADLAGIRDGDVILSVGDRAVNASNELQSVVARSRPGDRLTLQVWRDGEVQELAAELQGRESPAYAGWFAEPEREAPEEDIPDTLPAPRERGRILESETWGIGLRDLTESERSDFGIRAGAWIAYVESGSLADAAGLPRDVVIVEVEGSEVRSAGHALRAMEAAARVEAAVLVKVRRRDGGAAFYEMDVPALAD